MCRGHSRTQRSCWAKGRGDRARGTGLNLIISLLKLALQVGQIFHVSLNPSIELWFPNSALKHFDELMGILQLSLTFSGKTVTSVWRHMTHLLGEVTVSTLDPHSSFSDVISLQNWNFIIIGGGYDTMQAPLEKQYRSKWGWSGSRV